MKTVYVVDVPKIGDCDTCPLFDIEDVMNGTRMVCLVDKEEGEACPLRPLPKHIGFEETETETKEVPSGFYNETIDGWNWCLDEILGETE